MSNLAFYIYPLPYGTNYTADDLSVQDKVVELFNYCQILKGYISREGWDFLISHYGLDKLFQIDKASGWSDCESVKEYSKWVEYQKELSANETDTI